MLHIIRHYNMRGGTVMLHIIRHYNMRGDSDCDASHYQTLQHGGGGL